MKTISELSTEIHAGTLSPVELMESLLDRTESLNGKLNAFQLVPRERALATAKAAELALRAGDDAGPLHGIPYAAKDIIDVAGLPTTNGFLHMEGVANRDATVVAKLRKAGMVLLGKTNTVQFAMAATGINHHHGTPHNPWHAEHHVPGGSSSGSGVAVGAGMVPMALGTDTGGSVRIPAALCGTVGLKTTVGQVSRAGVFPLSTTLDSVGPLTWNVEDAALVYEAMIGRDKADSSTHCCQRHKVLPTLKSGVHGLRIAYATDLFMDDVDEEIGAAVESTKGVFAELGAHISEVEFPEAIEAHDNESFRVIGVSEAYVEHAKRLGDQFDRYDPIIGRRVIVGRDVPAIEYIRGKQACKEIAARACWRLRDVDALVTPTTRIPPRPLVEVDADIDEFDEWNFHYARNTRVANVLGLCAVTLTCGFTSDGLPIGLMIHSRPREEAMILRVAHAYEQATEWHQRTPDLSWAT